MRLAILLCLLAAAVGKRLKAPELPRRSDPIAEINKLHISYWTDGDETHLRKMFALIDANSDGEVTMGEVRTALQQSMNRAEVRKAEGLKEHFATFPEEQTFDEVAFVWTAGLASLL